MLERIEELLSELSRGGMSWKMELGASWNDDDDVLYAVKLDVEGVEYASIGSLEDSMLSVAERASDGEVEDESLNEDEDLDKLRTILDEIGYDKAIALIEALREQG